MATATQLALTQELDTERRSRASRQFSDAASLLVPALLIETASVGYHDASVTFSVNIGVNYASVLGRKQNALLRGGAPPTSNNTAMTALSVRTLQMYHRFSEFVSLA
jgi:hypothetical protein